MTAAMPIAARLAVCRSEQTLRRSKPATVGSERRRSTATSNAADPGANCTSMSTSVSRCSTLCAIRNTGDMSQVTAMNRRTVDHRTGEGAVGAVPAERRRGRARAMVIREPPGDDMGSSPPSFVECQAHRAAPLPPHAVHFCAPATTRCAPRVNDWTTN